MKVIVTFSGGKDSLAALLWTREHITKNFTTVFCDTGWEHPLTYECVGWSEIDKWAIKAHNAVFPELADRNYGDITKIDWNAVPNFDLFTYSFPCTDISSAGEQI